MDNNQLIAACANDDRKAQKKLYDQYSGQMYSICLRYCKDGPTASDALQTGFVKVFRSITSHNETGNMGAWIRRIIINACLDQIKIDKKHFTVDLEQGSQDFSYEHDIDFDDFNYKRLLGLLDHLPVGYRVVFSMFVLDSLSHKEIADNLSISQETSRTQLLKARKQLQQLIKEDKYLSLQYIKE